MDSNSSADRSTSVVLPFGGGVIMAQVLEEVIGIAQCIRFGLTNS